MTILAAERNSQDRVFPMGSNAYAMQPQSEVPMLSVAPVTRIEIHVPVDATDSLSTVSAHAESEFAWQANSLKPTGVRWNTAICCKWLEEPEEVTRFKTVLTERLRLTRLSCKRPWRAE